MKYIDIHAHCYRKPIPFVTLFHTPEQLIAKYDEYGIEMGALLPVVNSEIYLPQANEDILEMVENHPDRFFPFCNVDPRALINRSDAELDKVLQYYKDLGCKGVGEIMPNMPIDDDRVQNLFRCAEKVGLPVTTDGSDRPFGDFGLSDAPGLPGLEHTLQRFPDLKFIAHGPMFWGEYTISNRPAALKPVFRTNGGQSGSPRKIEFKGEGVAQELLRAFPNLYGELDEAISYFMADEDYAAKFITEFQDRLFFGTDACNSTTDSSFRGCAWFDKMHESGKLSDDVWKKVGRNNAIKFFNLPLELA